MRMGMPQLILDTAGAAVVLPESRKGGYTAQFTPLSVDVEMVDGRLTRELRGNVWVLTYKYNYFPEELKNRVIAACKKGEQTPIECDFLTADSGGTLLHSRFWVTAFTYPKFYWAKNDHGTLIPLWGGFSLTLREVKPSD